MLGIGELETSGNGGNKEPATHKVGSAQQAECTVSSLQTAISRYMQYPGLTHYNRACWMGVHCTRVVVKSLEEYH